MTYKNKSFLEDLIIIFIIVALIYGAYSLIFGEDKSPLIESTKIIIEEKPKSETQAETSTLKSIETPEEVKETEVIKEINQEAKIEETNKEQINQLEEPKEEIEKIEEKPLINEKAQIEENSSEITTKSFYTFLEKEVYKSIDKNLNKTLIQPNAYANIRVTILENGNFEQLTFMDGDKRYFDLARASILEIFPVKIPKSIQNEFPRYFRMKMENR